MLDGVNIIHWNIWTCFQYAFVSSAFQIYSDWLCTSLNKTFEERRWNMKGGPMHNSLAKPSARSLRNLCAGVSVSFRKGGGCGGYFTAAIRRAFTMVSVMIPPFTSISYSSSSVLMLPPHFHPHQLLRQHFPLFIRVFFRLPPVFFYDDDAGLDFNEWPLAAARSSTFNFEVAVFSFLFFLFLLNLTYRGWGVANGAILRLKT